MRQDARLVASPQPGYRLPAMSERKQEKAGGAEWSEGPGLVARGACMGMADVIPGVSGGTMALILGIYERLVNAIKSFDTGVLKALRRGKLRDALDRTHWKFLGLVVSGQALGIVLFTKVLHVPHLLIEYPEQIYGLFFGLVLGSVYLLGRDLLDEGPFDPKTVGGLALGLGVGLVVTQLSRGSSVNESPLFVFGAGAVAICAMILPGISGSFILLIFRQYAHVIGGLSTALSFTKDAGAAFEALQRIVIPFGLGCLTGIVLFSRVLSWVLKVAKRETMAAMVGLLIGSLAVIWPFQERVYETVRDKQRYVGSEGWLLPSADGASALALLLIAVGVGAVIALERVARKGNQRMLG